MEMEMAVPLSLVVAVPISIIIILWSAYKLYHLLRFKLPPGPNPWPVVGNLYQVKPLKCRCFAEWAEVYGPIMSVWFGSSLNVVVSNAEFAKEVLKDKDQLLADRNRNRLTTELSRGGQDLIWADYGSHYLKVRKVCNLELFSAKRLDSLTPIRHDEITAMIESIFRDCTTAGTDKIGKSMLMRKYLGSLALNHVTRLTFGKRFVNAEGVMDDEGLEFKAIKANGVKMTASLSGAEYVPWLRWMFPLEKAALAKHGARRDDLTRQIMEEHTRSFRASHHFVDALLTLQQKYDLTHDTIIGLLWDMIIAGMDTVAVAVEWAMAELINNPRVQQKVQEELDRVIGLDRVMTESDFSSLPYLQCVVKEALRLHPPTPLLLPHKASANVKIGGYDVPKGSIVHVNAWAVARDPAVWKEPAEFRPERFLEEYVNMKGHDFRLLPFGGGRRVRPGAQLAINLVTVMVGQLFHQFCWAQPHEGVDLFEDPGLIAYMRTPLQVVPTPRLPPHLYKRVISDM